MFELMAVVFAVFLLFVVGSVLAIVLKLAFKVVVIPLKLVTGLVLTVVSIGFALVAIPLALVAVPIVAVLAVLCLPFLLLGAVCWLGVQTLSFVF
jgi:hypothetical protein